MGELADDQDIQASSAAAVPSPDEGGPHTAPASDSVEADFQADAARHVEGEHEELAPSAARRRGSRGAQARASEATAPELTDPDLADAEDNLPDEEEEVPYDENVKPLEEFLEDENAEVELKWYILKVQSNRENSICEGLQRRVRVAGLDRFFGDILVPTEDVAEFKNGKRYVVKRKLYPGYIVLRMCLNDDTWFLVRETPGIGDFAGSAGKPTPMLSHEIERIIKSSSPKKPGEEPIKTAIPFKQGERVRIKEGTFENFEGEVENIDEANGRVTVMINIFGRSTPVELEHWQIGAI